MRTLRGGTVLTAEGFRDVDVTIADGRVVGLGTGASSGEVLDCTGCLIGPGFVDIHVHFREPGQTWKEDIETGSRAAAAGGFTAVVAMANTEPATDHPVLVDAMRARAAEVGLVDLEPAAALTLGRRGSEVSPIEDLYESGVRIFSDDGDSVADAVVLREAMERVAAVGGIVAQHAEDASMTSGGHMHEGEVSRRLGVGGLPAAAEVEVVARDLELAERTGVHYHVQHISVAETVGLVRSARKRGLNVTAEAAPHHFTLDHSRVRDGDGNAKMYPPLRTVEDVAAVASALRDGTIDAVATDHAPHSSDEKSLPFPEAPRGIIGLETAAALTWNAIGQDPLRFFEAMAIAPARIASFADHGRKVELGAPANLVVFDPSPTWTPHRFESRSQNSPWLGEPLVGRPRFTIFEGRLTHQGRVDG